MTEVVIGVDVGSGSARAGVFDLEGRALASRTQPIVQFRPAPGHVEQSSADIWSAVCACVRGAMAAAQARSASPLEPRGIGFDATCSLVATDAAGGPVSLSTTGRDDHDIIMWMDQRATDQAARINATGAEVLRYVGGRISPEMQTPKLLWLAENLPRAFAAAHDFFDLPDWLTFRATGARSRSLCSLVCKWTYLGHGQRWDEDYFRRIGLGVLADEGFARIGTEVLPPGEAVGQGLSAQGAAELGLPGGLPVSASAIDAHAGGIGLIGAQVAGGGTLAARIALIMGTSSCHMAVSSGPAFVPGVWGPYRSAMVPGLWLNEGGQSAVGSLIDHLVQSHAGRADLAADGADVFDTLNRRVATLSSGLAVPAALSAGLHVLPDFLGNRSPHADASLRGMISGLGLSASGDDLARLYLATCQSLAYGTRQIIEALDASGDYAIDLILACGGWTKNRLFLREHADATGCRIVLPEEPEAVLLGSAILGAVAGGAYPSIEAAMAAMSRAGEVIEPAGGAVRRYHDAKYAVFRRMHDDQMAYRALMATV